MYKFEEMRIENYDEITDLWSKTEDIELTVGDSKESLHKYLNRNPGMSFVCIDDSTGLMAGTILAGHDGRRGFIYHAAVAKQHRKKGVAKELIRLSTDALRKEGIQRCSLMVHTGNGKACTFWKANGWRQRNELIMFSKDL
jgi:ribosomal protein S18 acetylase RimI-like enzyme